MSSTRRVCLVGAGKVAQMHAPMVAQTRGVELVGVCDPDRARALRLADEHRIPHVFSSCEDAIASGTFDFAHVLVPPDRHVDLALALVHAGLGILIEKPMGRSAAECDAVIDAALEHDAEVGVNHNSVFYPAYLRLRRAVLERSLGALEHLAVTVHRPRHWLLQSTPWFRERPHYLAYESAVHPFAQVYDLAGAATEVASTASGRHDLLGGVHIFDTWQASLVCERATAQVSLSYGEYPAFHLLAICRDGVLAADVETKRFTAIDRTRWSRTRLGRYLQPLRVARKVAAQELAYGVENLFREARSIRSTRIRADPYTSSMQQSIAAFHERRRAGLLHVDGG